MMYLITPEQHAALLEALSNERYVSRYTHIVELIDMLKAMKPSEPVAWIDVDCDGQWLGGPRMFSDGNAREVPLYFCVDTTQLYAKEKK